MALILLVVIYIVFISLGLPDGVLGSAWPAIQKDLSQPVGLGGLLALILTSMTVVSSLATATLVKRLGIGRLLTLSVACTAVSLIGFSQASTVEWLFLLVIPLGLGAGAIDSALNDYVANHYGAHHMNWLHAFWGVGATLGPIIFAAWLASAGDWHKGYLNLGLIQVVVVVMLLFSLLLWNKVPQRKKIRGSDSADISEVKFKLLLKEANVRYAFLAFFLYVGIEVGVGLWLASYLVKIQHLSMETASLWTGIYYGAITLGRIIAGFVTFKVQSVFLVRYGIALSLLGAALLVLNITSLTSLIGISLVGLGFAPIFPSLIHETPERFGANKSAKVMSLQIVGGYIGASSIPPFIGLLAGVINLHTFAYILPLTIVCLFVSTELSNKLVRKN